ncbi:hypothetical protein KIL84_004580 [Mauremys mutica]|uniref:Uncharacterized protein n=1 Tax=Mauremys mutica TaxID=74926 RepID=A0A9D4B6G9_9SAUR|nr:hypothetical protein KIL84_004580 [Mauremys mutica]
MIRDLSSNPGKPTDLWGEPTAQSGISPKLVSGPWSRIQTSLHHDFKSQAPPPARCSPQCSLSTQTSHVGSPHGSTCFCFPRLFPGSSPRAVMGEWGWLWTWAGQGAEHTTWPMTRMEATQLCPILSCCGAGAQTVQQSSLEAEN